MHYSMSIVIGSIARDVAPYVKTIMESYNRLKSLCKREIQYVIFENDSVDGSVSLLRKWADDDKSVHFYSETVDTSIFRARNTFNNPCKYEVIAYARNRLMTYVKSIENVQTVIFMDMNNENAWPVENILNVLEIPHDQYDALICNGINSSGCIIDTFSFRDLSTAFGPEIMGDLYYEPDYQKEIKKNFFNHEGTIPVFSAFNGLAVLNRELLDKTEYSAFPTKELNEFYRNTCDKFVLEVHPCVNEKHIGMFAFPDKDIFYYNFNNFNIPIISPHVTFFAKLQAAGHNQIMICPFLEWKWYKDTLFIL